MTEDEFLALARAGCNRIPLQLETLADLDTPLSIYLKLANRPGSYLLESVIGGERFGRYSIVGLPAREMVEARGNRVRRAARRRGGRGARRRRPAAVRRRVPALVPRRAAGPAAALRGRPRGLLRLRHGALRRAQARARREARSHRPARHPPAALRGARGGRQPLGQAAPHRVRRSRGARRARQGARAPGGAEGPAAQARGAAAPRCALHARGSALQHRRGEVLRGGGALQALHRGRRHLPGADLAAHRAAVPVLAGEPLPVAALDQSLAVHVLFRLRRRAAGGRLARDPGAARGRQGDAAPHRRHAPPRRDAREGPGDGARAAGRSRRSAPST